MASKSAMYAALNNRFDERARWLMNKGYKYEHVKDYDIEVFIKGVRGFKPHVIQAGTVMNANEEVWEDVANQVMDRH